MGTDARGALERPDRTRDVYERDAHAYAGRELLAPERMLLRRLRDRWPVIDMLDVGVGGGRTAFTFGALCRTYLGVDYAPRMVDLARRMVGEDDRCRFAIADARDLEALGADFDVVLFSFNGLDTVDGADRVRCLRQVHRVLRDDGLFLLSSHSIDGLPLPSPLRRLHGRRLPVKGYALPRLAVPALRTAATNARLDPEVLQRRGWTRLRDEAHDFDLPLFYVTAAYQVTQLESLGFEVIDILDREGRSRTPASPGGDLWLHFLSRKAGARP